MDLISREQAIEAGLNAYFTGVPCNHGHISQRRTINRACKVCTAIEAKRRYDTRLAKDPAYVQANRERAKAWAQSNQERYKQNQQRWREENPGAITKLVKKWNAENPERASDIRRARDLNRRTRKKANGGKATADELKALRQKQNGRCAHCRKKSRGMEFDHILPVAKGGSGHIHNLQLLCKPCNRTKRDKDPIAWAQASGRLL